MDMACCHRRVRVGQVRRCAHADIPWLPSQRSPSPAHAPAPPLPTHLAAWPPCPLGGTLLLYGSICRDCRTSLRIRVSVTVSLLNVTLCMRGKPVPAGLANTHPHLDMITSCQTARSCPTAYSARSLWARCRLTECLRASGPSPSAIST